VTQSAQVAEAAPGAVQPPSRRDRLRAATIDEIIQTARQLLVKDGPEAVSLRAIAREMGMTAPGLYRYFGSYEELHRYLCANIFTELGADIHRAIEAAAAPSEDPHAKLTVKMVAACREFRRWALTHKDEFALVFGVPLPFSMPMALRISTEAGGVFRMKVKLRSLYTVITTGVGNPFSRLCVCALNALQNSMMFRPR